MVGNVEVFVNKECRVILQEVANQFSICKGSAHQILQKNLGLSKVSARWVLKQSQKASRVIITKENFLISSCRVISKQKLRSKTWL